MTGAGASVVRAAVMGSLLLLSLSAGRLYAIAPALCAAALSMLVINPRILYWDIGFQLSFLATLGIVFGISVLDKLTPKIQSWFGLKEIVMSTLCATIATLPVILLNFGRLSVVAVLANLLVLPFIPLIMLLGFLIVIPFMGPGFGYVASLFLNYVLAVTRKLSAWPWASLDIKIGPEIFVLLWTIIFAAYFWLKSRAEAMAVEENQRL